MDRPPNVALVVLDTVRAGELPPYGYDRATAPALSRFAGRSDVTVYERAYANAPWTLPSHASLFTGLLPSEHRCTGGSPSLSVPAERTLAGRLRAAGYDTRGASNNVFVSDHFGLTAGFETFYKQWQLFREAGDVGHLAKRADVGTGELLGELLSGNPVVNLLNGLYGKYVWRRSDSGAARTTRDAAELIADATEPFFLFVNYMEAHAPYEYHGATGRFLPSGVDPAETDRLTELSAESKAYHLGQRSVSDREFERVRALYDGEIRYLDGHVDRLLDAVPSNTVVAVVGDHGENVGDHGLMAHRFSVHDTLLHVPLMIRYPEGYADGVPDRVGTPVDLRDLFAELATVPEGGTEMPVDGRSADDPVVAEYLSTAYTPEARDPDVDLAATGYDRRLAAAVTADYKYVRASDGERRLYRRPGSESADGPGVDSALDFERDGTELDPDGEGAAVADRLDGHCEAVREGVDDGTVAVDGAVRDRLEDLGYV